MNHKQATQLLRYATNVAPELDGGEVIALSGGISNEIFVVSKAGCDSVLIRVYGTGEPLCERTSEEAMVQQLTASGFGPRVLSTFGHGRVEEFLPNRRALLPSESLSTGPPDFSAIVAARLAELHELAIVIPGRCAAEEQLTCWLSGCPSSQFVTRELLAAEIAGVPGLRPAAGSDAEQEIEARLLERRLCHLDLFASNILYSESEGGVAFIDYEYAAAAPVGLDIANHFSGCTESIDGACVSFQTNLYPLPAAQLHFLASYFTARRLPPLTDPAAIEFALRLLIALAAEAELRWVVWGLVMWAKPPSAAFDYADYAAQRWRCYCTYKQWSQTGDPRL
jgi:thiamine kinase-like enzyme|mmetsp:Transcript_45201/g.102062  ORF Transcript_45201/g.102062 Transcript_45201/m.102062 type:complete len:338 (-) Transcript_45201:216-1229(-)